MYFPEINYEDNNQFNKIKFSVYAAAALMILLKKQRDAVGLSMFSNHLELHSDTKSNQVHHKFLMHELEKALAQPSKNITTSTVEALHTIAETIHKRSLIILFSDMLDNTSNESELFEALKHLKYNKHEVILFHTYDRKLEIDFEFENRPYQFIDLETGEQIKLHPAEVKKNYIENMQKRKDTLRLKCLQFGIDFVEADVNQGFNSILQTYLIKRAKML